LTVISDPMFRAVLDTLNVGPIVTEWMTLCDPVGSFPFVPRRSFTRTAVKMGPADAPHVGSMESCDSACL